MQHGPNIVRWKTDEKAIQQVKQMMDMLIPDLLKCWDKVSIGWQITLFTKHPQKVVCVYSFEYVIFMMLPALLNMTTVQYCPDDPGGISQHVGSMYTDFLRMTYGGKSIDEIEQPKLVVHE